MQTKTPAPVPSVVKCEDKMQNLRTFITSALMMPGIGSKSGVLTLVARSTESPVARALVSLACELNSRGLTVRAIFGQLGADETATGWSVAGPDIAFQRDLRWAKNPRLADAHEQLVLADDTCWIGDCLRRDPSRRDAYEHFVPADVKTARTMQMSFERLWSASVPLLMRQPNLNADAPRPAGLADDTLAALVPRDENSGPLMSSPH